MITVEEWNCTYAYILVYIGEYAIDKSTEFSGFETIKELCRDLYFHIPYMKNSGTLCPEILITLLVRFHGFRFIPKPKKDDGFDFVINLHPPGPHWTKSAPISVWGPWGPHFVCSPLFSFF